MQHLARTMLQIGSRLDKLEEVPNWKELRHTTSKSPEMMEEVEYFIHNWLKSWPGAYPSAWDGISTELLVQLSTSPLSSEGQSY